MAIVSVTRSTYVWQFKHKTRKSDSERFVANTEAIAKLWPFDLARRLRASRISSTVLWTRSPLVQCHWQMLLTGREERQFRMPNDHARGNTGIGRDGLVSSIAGHDSRARLANHASQDQHCRPVAIFTWKPR